MNITKRPGLSRHEAYIADELLAELAPLCDGTRVRRTVPKVIVSVLEEYRRGVIPLPPAWLPAAEVAHD